MAVGAAKVSGIDGASSAPAAPPSLYIPSGEPTTGLDAYPDPAGTGPSSSSPSATPSATPTKKPRAITLRASPLQVSANERINLTGSSRGTVGAQLQVQRFESGWVDFPVTATVRGGVFGTYIYTGRSGVNRLRVLDPTTGRASNVVRVTVG
jgi:hypothetical protein